MTSPLYYLAQITKGDINLPGGDVKESTVPQALLLVFGVAGAITLLVITVAGLQYVLSQGNPQATAKAKNTILYALIGLAICIFAFAIVKFVIGNL
jgi:hypothetical protein